jgi:hypothetical protein
LRRSPIQVHPDGTEAVTALPVRAGGEPTAVAGTGMPMVIMTLVHT